MVVLLTRITSFCTTLQDRCLPSPVTPLLNSFRRAFRSPTGAPPATARSDAGRLLLPPSSLPRSHTEKAKSQQPVTQKRGARFLVCISSSSSSYLVVVFILPPKNSTTKPPTSFFSPSFWISPPLLLFVMFCFHLLLLLLSHFLMHLTFLPPKRE